MPTPSKNEVILFTDEEIPAAEAEVLNAIQKVLKQPIPDLLAIPMAILSVQMSWQKNLQQAKEAEHFDANQSLRALQDREQDARNRFPDQVVAAKSEQLVSLQQQLREEIASIAEQRADLETKRDGAQNNLQILIADLEKSNKLTAQLKKPAITNANVPLFQPTINVLSRLLTISPVREEATLVLSPGQDLLTTARDTIAASRTRTLAPATNDLITIEVERRKPGRQKLSDTPTPIHLNVSAILKEEGIDLSQLAETNAQGVAVSLKALLRNDLGIKDPTPDDMEKALRGIVRGNYREVLDNRRTLLALDGLAKPKDIASIIIEEPKIDVAKTQFTAQPQAIFSASEPKARKPLLVIEKDDPLAAALRTKKGGLLVVHNPGDLAKAVTGIKRDSYGTRAAQERGKVFESLEARVNEVIRDAKSIGIKTLNELAEDQRINIPNDMRSSLRASITEAITKNAKFQAPIDSLTILPGLVRLNESNPAKPKTLTDLLLKLDEQTK